MHRSLLFLLGAGLLSVLGLTGRAIAQGPVDPSNSPPALQNPIEPQTRGPIHEAFAQPFDPNAGPSAPAPKQPPAPINEQPPDQKPDAENAQWIPGYWAWDAQRQEYLWVSGVYRVPPQGRTYVPGYWSQGTDGWRWVPGFWTAGNAQDIPNTPEPPASLENGPSMPAPNANSGYIPGAWVYGDQRFAWRPGYYAPLQSGRVWIPAQYSWTPNGYVFVAGYWDYPLESRGLAFAPVAFNSPVYADPGFSYQPNYVIDPLAFLNSGFTLGNNYYFGNYYGPSYAQLGYRPWYAGAGRYDPTFGYYGWRTNPRNSNWLAGVQQTYASRGNGTLAGPPLTLAQQNTRTGIVVRPLSQVARVVRTSPAQLAVQQRLAQQSRTLALRRSQQGAVGRVNQATPLSQRPVQTFRATPQVRNFAGTTNAPAIRNVAPAVSAAPRVVRPAPIAAPRYNAPHPSAYRPATSVRPTQTFARPAAPAYNHAHVAAPPRMSAPVHTANRGVAHSGGGAAHHGGGGHRR